jgi:hypothetical protein
VLAFAAVAFCTLETRAQTGSTADTGAGTTAGGPIAIVSLAGERGTKVSGALEVSGGKAVIVAGGTVESGAHTTEVVLPHRGTLRVCASTVLKLAADSSVPAGETPGLMMAMDHGAMEASFATGKNADIVMTPDFRILIGGPGAADVKVRLGEHGDTCVDNAGAQATFVLVSSVFEDGAYRVQGGQRVMFEHGSLRSVVDQEKEPCGCPPAETHGNEFPLAESEGLAPGAGVLRQAPGSATEALTYNAAKNEAAVQPAGPVSGQGSEKPPPPQKPGVMARVRRFLRRIFGAE